MPTGGTIGEAIVDDDPHGQINHPMRVMPARRGHIAQIDVAMLPAVGTVVTRVGHSEGHWTTGVYIAQVV
jgi:hypothetical protein